MLAGISRKQIWLIVGGVVVLLVILIMLVDLQEIVSLLRDINWIQLAAAAIFLMLGHLFVLFRLRYILLDRAGWWETFYGNSIGYLVHIAMFIPALVGRAVCVGWITPIPVAQVSSALLIERLLETTMRVLIIVLALTVFATNQDPFSSVGGSLIFLTVGFGVLFWLLNHRESVVNRLALRLTGFRGISETQVRSTASSMLQGLDAIGSASRLILSLLLSCTAWAFFFVFHYLVISALPVSLSTNEKLAVAVAILAVMPPSVNVMLIIYQVVVILVLLALGLTDGATALVYSIVLYLMMLMFWAILGGWSYSQTDLRFSQLVAEVKQYTGKGSTTPKEVA